MPFLTGSRTGGLVVATDQGEVAAERLRVGDLVMTRDNGLQRIRWIGTRQLEAGMRDRDSRLCPLHIAQGTLDGWLPEVAMCASPNQRILAPRDRSLIRFEEHEALVSAKHMVGSRAVPDAGCEAGAYWHPVFDRHEMILVNGAWCEAFHPGDVAMNGLGNAQRFEIYALFPELETLLAEASALTPNAPVVRLPLWH